MEEEILEQRKQILTELMDDRTYVPTKAKELAILLNIPESQRDELTEVLSALVTGGRIDVSKKGKYGKPETFSTNGIFFGHPKDFGFMTVDGMEQDIFIPKDRTGAAMHGDRVQIVVESGAVRSGHSKSGMGVSGCRVEDTVIKMLEHTNKGVVGYYQKNKSFSPVIPDSRKLAKDVSVPRSCDVGAVTGHKVVARIKDYGNEKYKPGGRITEILNHVNDPGTDILSIVGAYGLPEGFPQAVMDEVQGIEDSLEIPGSQEQVLGECRINDLKTHEDWTGGLVGRLDLRGPRAVTMDGEDAKDLNDAVTTCKTGEGTYILGIHIADVSHYVKGGNPSDKEALKRSTSVYLVDQVIPMPPHRPSNGICPLNTGTNRLALSCIMEVDAQGTVTDHKVAGTVIHVDRRTTYTTVNTIVTNRDEAVMAKYKGLIPMLDCMKELSLILREERHKRGVIDFDFPESRILPDPKGEPLGIKPYVRGATTKIIEDFMLLANETVAEDHYWQSIPFPYRSHDNPDPEEMKRLGTSISNFGYLIRMQHGRIHPKEPQKLLDKIEGMPEEALFSRLTLCSVKQAKYTTLCSGHFGLATRYYTHFTSPIGRYPDLQIHRIIKENLEGGLGSKRTGHCEHILPEVAVRTPTLECRVDKAGRETDKLKKCEYMSQFIGQEFDGVIPGVTSWGLYMELPSTVGGLMRMSDLSDDYYILDEQHYELTREMTRKTYKLEQPVRVTVSGTDQLLRTADFVLARD